MRRLSICYVSPHALPVLTGFGPSGPGGAELQQAMVGRELARLGHRVAFVVGAPEEAAASRPREIDGLTVIACPLSPRRADAAGVEAGLEKGIRLLREAGRLWRAMDQARADIYAVRSNHLAAALAAAWCRTWGVPFVFASGHDGNCDLSLAHRRPRRAVGFSYAASLRGAAAVVVQGESQRRMMERNFAVRAEVIPNAVPLDRPPGAGRREGVLWVGAIEPRKGADRLLDIAASLPGVAFAVVGGAGDHPLYHETCLRRARSLPNVKWHGPLPPGQTLRLFARAAIYLNTSRSEGFPNTFLDAWMAGTPVVSFQVDPDGVLSRQGMGLVARDAAGAGGVILELLGEPRRREAMARAAKRWAERRHGLPGVARRWEDLFGAVAARGSAPGGILAGAA